MPAPGQMPNEYRRIRAGRPEGIPGSRAGCDGR